MCKCGCSFAMHNPYLPGSPCESAAVQDGQQDLFCKNSDPCTGEGSCEGYEEVTP